ncbi:hypothetical protein AX15_000740 [Amanita polypyramis BW_CC]|nr:hypothetical protein AX15_000740 [Amanita polypyramis BW_CC]
MYYAKINDPVLGPLGVRILLCFRGLAGFFGIFGLYFSLQYLSLSDAIVLTFLTPLCTAISGSVLLKEKFTAREALAGVVSLVGVVLIAQPPFLFGAGIHRGEKELRSIEIPNEAEVSTAQRMVAIGGALVGVAGATCEYTLIRAIGKRAHPLHNIVYLSVFCVIASSIGMVATHTSIIIPTRWSFVGMLFLVGVFGFCAQTLMTMGYQLENIGHSSMGVYTGIIFALILGRIIFGTVPSILSLLGTVLILGSAIYVAVMKNSGTEGAEGKNKIITASEGEEDVEIGLLEMDERKSAGGESS